MNEGIEFPWLQKQAFVHSWQTNHIGVKQYRDSHMDIINIYKYIYVHIFLFLFCNLPTEPETKLR